jgi:hypothetical protein
MRTYKFFASINQWVIFAAFLNTLSFVVISIIIGGTAFNGEVVGGQYFIGAHGDMEKVSKGVFQYSLWHGISAAFFLVVAVILTGVAQWGSRNTKRNKERMSSSSATAYDYVVLVCSIIFAILVFVGIFYRILH